MERRTFLKGAATVVTAAACPMTLKAESRKRLYLVNPVAKNYYEMFLKKDSPIKISQDVTSNQYCCVFNHTTQCEMSGAIGLFGLSIKTDQDVRIRMMIDGEIVLMDIHAKTVSDSWIPKPGSGPTSLFSAYTPKHCRAGLFLPNGTNIVIKARANKEAISAFSSSIILRTAIYGSHSRNGEVADWLNEIEEVQATQIAEEERRKRIEKANLVYVRAGGRYHDLDPDQRRSIEISIEEEFPHLK